jgi:hypothetical protein
MPRGQACLEGGRHRLMLISRKRLGAASGYWVHRLPKSFDRQGSGIAPSATRISFH